MLKRLTVHNVRNIVYAELDGLAGVNLITGDNGAGKTSVLEAIHMLATARSFRHSQARPVIRQGQASLLVSGRWQDADILSHRLGIERWLDGRVRIRGDGERINTAAELAALLPVQLLNAEAFALVEGSPGVRRQFFDWGVFHVEHEFFPTWSTAQRALKQRNALLKHGRIDRSAWRLWTEAYTEPGEQLQRMRSRHFLALQQAFQGALEGIAPDLVGKLELALYQGWATGRSLLESLEADAEIDQQRGFTRAGPHRADLRIKVAGAPAHEVLSRGQIKAVAAALKLAQGTLLSEAGRRRCIYLIDDLAAELDEAHRARLARKLVELGAQVFVTALDRDMASRDWPQASNANHAMFHVEHGVIKLLAD